MTFNDKLLKHLYYYLNINNSIHRLLSQNETIFNIVNSDPELLELMKESNELTYLFGKFFNEFLQENKQTDEEILHHTPTQTLQ